MSGGQHHSYNMWVMYTHGHNRTIVELRKLAPLLCLSSLHSIPVSDKVLSVMHYKQGMVMKFNATVTTIRQVITWTAPLEFHNITHYLVKYGKADEINGSSDVNIMTERTKMNLTRVVLLIQMPQKHTPETYSVSYSVWVAAVSGQRQGAFSDRHNFTYASETTIDINCNTCVIMYN